MLLNFENGGLSDDDEEQEEEVEELEDVDKQTADDEDESGEEYEDDEDEKAEEHPLLKLLLETGKIEVPKQTKVPKATNGTKENRPSTKQMVHGAINELNERSGSSIQAIKSYITSNYPQVNANRNWLFIKKYLKRGVENGQLIQVKGTGARGSFKLAAIVEKENAAKKKQQKEKIKLKAQEKRNEGGNNQPTQAVKATDDSKQKKPKAAAKPSKSEAKTSPTVADKAELKTKQAPKKPMKTTVTEEAAPEKNAVPAKKDKLPPKTSNGAAADRGRRTKLARRSITVNIIKQPARSKAAAKQQSIAAVGNEEGRASKRGAKNGAKPASTEQLEVVAKKPSGKAKKK